MGLKDPMKKKKARMMVRMNFEEKYKSGKNKWFFQKLDSKCRSYEISSSLPSLCPPREDVVKRLTELNLDHCCLQQQQPPPPQPTTTPTTPTTTTTATTATTTRTTT